MSAFKKKPHFTFGENYLNTKGMKKIEITDGNQAAAHIAYRTSEVCAIYPITPSSPMGEWAEEWSSQEKKNIWGEITRVVTLQSEAGAAGAIHGALQSGVMASTFTCSQGLLLMIPNMYKIAGELTPTVFHISARALATHALSIFGDHSDVMAVRQTGFAMLFGANPQEAHDMAMIATSASLKSRIPFLNIFDGFRTSHELNMVEIIPDETIKDMISEEDLARHRLHGLNPSNPVIRGTTQNPDVFFQSREASNIYHDKVAEIVIETMDQFEKLTGRAYKLFDYYGDANAEQVIIIMGSGAGAVYETVDYLNKQGKKVGCLHVHLFRPFSVSHFINALPASVKGIAVLDRCKENGALGEPLYMDVVTALHQGWASAQLPVVIGGRYGLGSKEFTPAMVQSVYQELEKTNPKRQFTVGIEDDVTHLSLDYDKTFSIEDHLFKGLFYGLGADGTVSANKNTIKIIGDVTDYSVQGYFVYDSKKSGSLTVSHLRFSNHNIRSSYLVNAANFVACHQFQLIMKHDILKNAEHGATFLLNSPYGKDEVWNVLPKAVQTEIVEKELKFYVIDASKVGRDTGMGSKINGILQTCFFAISNVLPQDEAIGYIKKSIKKTYGKKGDAVVEKNYNAVDKALENLFKVDYSQYKVGEKGLDVPSMEGASDFVKNVLSQIIAGEGDDLPVSAMPLDGTYPTATTQYEKSNLAEFVPVWDEASCSQCGKCFIICPHAAIRPKVVDRSLMSNAPATFRYVDPVGKEFSKADEIYTLQVSVEDCTGCNLCVEVCPVPSKKEPANKCLKMEDVIPLKEAGKENWDFFLGLPQVDRTRLNPAQVRSSQLLEPLFEFSGACAGCGETPYLKLMSQLFGSRMLVANATGCSSIFGGNLPTTPWAKNCEGQGPAWANSLFEDNAEFGLGMKLASDQKKIYAISLLNEMKVEIGVGLVESILANPQVTPTDFAEIHARIIDLKVVLANIASPKANILLQVVDFLENKSVWIVGGDGWAYDIGYGGLDHVLSTGENINIMVLDTEVYSNTGGQKSKSTPTGANAKFATAGKRTGKKDLAMQAMAHGTAYVAEIAIGANDVHTLKTILEAEAYPGPSIIIAYSHCISHGFNIEKGLAHQAEAVKSGYWPLFRYNPANEKGKRFTIDCKEPTVALEDFMYKENRFAVIKNSNPENGLELLEMAKEGIVHRWERLEAMKAL